MTTTAHVQEGNAAMTTLIPERIEEIRGHLQAAIKNGQPDGWREFKEMLLVRIEDHVLRGALEIVSAYDALSSQLASHTGSVSAGSAAIADSEGQADLAKALRKYAATEHGKRSKLHIRIMRLVFSDPLSLVDALSRDGMREALVNELRREASGMVAQYSGTVEVSVDLLERAAAALSPDAPRQKEG